MSRLPRGERGAIGGMEMLPLGFLVFVVGSLLIVNAWTVVDSWLAVSAAAREGARTYVEADPDEAWPEARSRILEVMDNYGRGGRALDPTPPAVDFERCSLVTITASYDLAFINLPFVGGFGALTNIEASHSERIDPYREGPFEGSCA
ncbi:MAG: hypothetical protein ACR2P0_17010 [Acidimicrobiales bacterium]